MPIFGTEANGRGKLGQCNPFLKPMRIKSYPEKCRKIGG